MAKDNRFELWYRVFYDIFFNINLFIKYNMYPLCRITRHKM